MYTTEIGQWMAEADRIELNVEMSQTESVANDRLI